MLQLIQQFMPNVYRMGWSGQAGWGTAIYLTLYMTIIPFFYRRDSRLYRWSLARLDRAERYFGK